MKRLISLFTLLAALLIAPAGAGRAAWHSVLQVAVGGASFAGPGDAVASAGGFWSFARAYSAAYATANGVAGGISRILDGVTCNLTFPSPGYITATAGVTAGCSNGTYNGQTLSVFQTSRTTCTAATGSGGGSFAVSLTGCGVTPAVGDKITGTVTSGTFYQPTIIIAVNSFAGGTASVSTDSSLAFTMTGVNVLGGITVTSLADQTGGGNTLTTTGAPYLVTGCNTPTARTCVEFGNWTNGAFQSAANASLSTPISTPSMYAVWNIYQGFSNNSWPYSLNAGPSFSISSGSSDLNFSCGTGISPGASAGVWFELTTVCGTGTSGVFNINGTDHTGNAGSTTGSVTSVYVDRYPSGGFGLPILISEMGMWPALSSGGRSALHSSAASASAYGTP